MINPLTAENIIRDATEAIENSEKISSAASAIDGYCTLKDRNKLPYISAFSYHYDTINSQKLSTDGLRKLKNIIRELTPYKNIHRIKYFGNFALPLYPWTIVLGIFLIIFIMAYCSNPKYRDICLAQNIHDSIVQADSTATDYIGKIQGNIDDYISLSKKYEDLENISPITKDNDYSISLKDNSTNFLCSYKLTDDGISKVTRVLNNTKSFVESTQNIFIPSLHPNKPMDLFLSILQIINLLLGICSSIQTIRLNLGR